MKKAIVVVGATGNLGTKIISALLAKGAEVRAIVRLGADAKKILALEQKGVKVFQVDTSSTAEIAKHMTGAHCVVSALAGLRETIVDFQKIVLDAALQAKVQRFIPSDYSSDFTNLVEGKNRNFDLRREFHNYLDKQPIQATSIFNGAFMDLLVTDMPLILYKKKRILCWGNSLQKMEFTITDNVAEYTAEVAMDVNTPRYLRIAGDTLSCADYVKLMTDLSAAPYRIFRPGGIGLLNFMIGLTRFFSPGNKELYPAWQGMQYMRDMMEGRIVIQKHDNSRYPTMQWLTAKEFLKQHPDRF